MDFYIIIIINIMSNLLNIIEDSISIEYNEYNQISLTNKLMEIYVAFLKLIF